MKDLIKMLNTDSTLAGLIGANRVLPNFASDTNTCVVYEFYTVKNDAVKKQYRLTLRIVAANLTTCDAVEDRLAALMLTFGDSQLSAGTTKYLKIEQNGGGTLKDPDTGLQHRLLYYDVLRAA